MCRCIYFISVAKHHGCLTDRTNAQADMRPCCSYAEGLRLPVALFSVIGSDSVKDKDYCTIEIIKGLTDKGQFQYLTN